MYNEVGLEYGMEEVGTSLYQDEVPVSAYQQFDSEPQGSNLPIFLILGVAVVLALRG